MTSRPPARSLVDTTLVHEGVPGIALQGDRVRLTVFPVAGAKILNLVHRASGYDLLWQNPRVPLRATYPGASFDDIWCGGWDELFPTDAACELHGNHFHDHGDLWFGPWKWSVDADDDNEATISMWRQTVALPCLMERSITVTRDSLDVVFAHRLTNLGTQPIAFCWNIHVAHAIAAGSRLHLPTARLGLEPPGTGRFGAVDEIAWPLHGDADVSVALGPDAGITEFLYARGLTGGWCAVTHPEAGVGLALAFDTDVFRTVWAWGVFGGWRGHHVLLTEPATSPPGGLARSVAEGTAAELAGGATLQTRVVASVLEGIDPGRRGDEHPTRDRSATRP